MTLGCCIFARRINYHAMKTIFDFIKPYLFAALCFMVAIVLTKTIEALAISTDINLGIYFRSITMNLIVSSISCLCILPIYIAINFFSKKGALLTTSILLSIVILTEISLAVYTAHNGTLLGSELLVRPASELFMAVNGAFGIFVPIISVIAIVAGFTSIVMLLSRFKVHNTIYITTGAILLLSIPCSFFTKKLLTNEYATDNFICNKSYFLARDCYFFCKDESENINDKQIVYNQDKIEAFLADNPDYNVPDPKYPLERLDNTPDVLSQYFTSNGQKPNIVVILVESLGHEFMEPAIVPFIDSLAQTGLYWENCLSTTMRSFGAVPAITASVCGPRGFQFGNMPEHNSIISVLNQNKYQTNVFYGGDLTFDCIYEYLTNQNIKHIAPYWQEYLAKHDSKLGSWWGYHDEILFEKSIKDIKKQGNTPKFNLLITLTNHENFNIADKEKYFTDLAAGAAEKLPAEKKEFAEKNKGRIASVLYTDKCIQDFVNNYKNLPEYDNTIFIITGDHSSGISVRDELSYYHVPLIIWSPMLNAHKKFSSVVTHFDIVPSLMRLLHNTYKIATPETAHCIGKGLNVSEKIEKDAIMPIINYAHELNDIVYKEYFYRSKTKWYDATLYKINDDMSLSVVNDERMLEEIKAKFDLYKYIIQYTYLCNKVTSSSVYDNKRTEAIDVVNKSDILCTTPQTKPSVSGQADYYLLENYKVENTSKYEAVKITLDADIYINDSLWIDQYMDLTFENNGTNAIKYNDKIVKFLNEEVIHKDSIYHLNIAKQFPVESDSNNSFSILVSSPKYDDAWVPDSKLTIKNTSIKIEGVIR